MKRFEVSTEIGSLSVTYQKQKKVLVCLNGAGLLPSYENFSLILEKPPPTIGYLTIDFPNTGRSPIHDQAGKNLDNLADAVYEVLEELGISEYILCAHSWSGILACKLLEKPIKGLELENQDPEFQISGEITEEDFEDVSIEAHIPVFVFCQPYREKEYRESEYWTSNTKLILGGNHHYLQWSESEKIAAII